MSADLEALLSAQRDIHGRISRSVDNLKSKGSANITAGTVQTRLQIIDNLWAKFEAQHESIRAAYEGDYEKSEYVTSNFFDVVENTYVSQRGTLVNLAAKLTPAAPPSTPPSNPNSEHAPKTSLPRITLPTFSGAYADWPAFRDLFLSVIGENPAVSNVERLHYLKSCLQGPAATLIQTLSFTGDNYARAWSLLCKQYENKRELIRSNFAAFTAVAKMKSDTADELSRIYHAVTAATYAQEAIGRPIQSHGMDLFNFLVAELFDPRTRLEWESAISDSLEPPAHTELINFISKRILTLNAARPKCAKPPDSPKVVKVHLARQSSDPQCVLCKGKHALMSCAQFRSKSAADRKTFVDNSRVCFNCLGNHPASKCQSTKTCFKCESRHHTLLHDACVSVPSNDTNVLSTVRSSTLDKDTLLATARVLINNRSGQPCEVRALIDQGSQISLVSEALVQRLRLTRSCSAVNISGVGCTDIDSPRGRLVIRVTSANSGVVADVNAYILPRITKYHGPSARSRQTWSHISGLPLADPQYADDDPVELLLGAEVCSAIIQDGVRRGESDAPLAQRTSFGWILSGGGGIAPDQPRSRGNAPRGRSPLTRFSRPHHRHPSWNRWSNPGGHRQNRDFYLRSSAGKNCAPSDGHSRTIRVGRPILFTSFARRKCYPSYAVEYHCSLHKHTSRHCDSV